MKKLLPFLLILLISQVLSAQDAHWVTTWGNAPQRTEKRNMPPAPGISDSSLRQKFRVSIGGDTIKVQFSNAFGNGPVVIKAAEIAVAGHGYSIDPETSRVIMFNGNKGITIPEKEAVWSDPLDFHFEGLTELALTIYFGEVPKGLTGHPGSRTTSFMKPGNHVSEAKFSKSLKTNHWYILTRVDVQAEEKSRAVVILGDSIADGRGSTTNRNNRWPDNLAARFQESKDLKHVAVVNMGIGGNSLITGGIGPKGLQRLERDVLDVAGVRWLMINIGVNDIGQAGGSMNVEKTPKRMIKAYQDIIAAAHGRGIKVYLIPILPFKNSGYSNPDNLKIRETVNNWMYTSGEADAVIPLEHAIEDPDDPEKLIDNLDDSDYLHLNPEGYKIMADSIDLDLFRE